VARIWWSRPIRWRLRAKSWCEVQQGIVAAGVSAALIWSAAPSALGANTLLSREGMKQLDAQISRLVAQMHKCWTPRPPKVGLSVELIVDLDREGNVVGTPRLASNPGRDTRQFADAAIKAVKDCGPYTFDAADYDTWKQVDIEFKSGE